MRIGIFFGGQSREREISFAGGRTVFDNLNKNLFEAVPVFVDSIGNFILLNWEYVYKGTIRDFYPPFSEIPNSPHQFQIYIESLGKLSAEDNDRILSHVGHKIHPSEFSKIMDFAFLALHGPYGEDGNIQGLLEWYNIPYSGSGILPSSIGINKIVQKQLMSNAGFKGPKNLFLSKDKWLSTKDKKSVFKELETQMGLPFVIKAPYQGSSIGIAVVTEKDIDVFTKAVNKCFFTQELNKKDWEMMSDDKQVNFLKELTDIREGIGMPVTADQHKLINHPEDLLVYIREAFKKSDKPVFLESMDNEEEIIIESFIEGKEFSCIVIQDEAGLPLALPPTEIVKGNKLFDYRSKYLPGMTRKVTPIDLPQEQIENIRKDCEKLFRELHFNVYARLDGFINSKGEIFLNDPNTTSGMLPSSFFFHQAAEIGMNPSQFLTYIIRTSLVERIKTGKKTFAFKSLLKKLDESLHNLKIAASKKIRVGVIMGGFSSERHISVESGRNIYEKLASSTKYEPIPVFLTGSENDHQMYMIPVNIMLKDNADDIKEKVLHITPKHPVIKNIIKEAAEITDRYVHHTVLEPVKISYKTLAEKVDAVFIALHGRPGEDGSVQVELEKYNIPYNGSGIESSRITINKFETNEILRKKGMNVANHMLVTKKEWDESVDKIIQKIESGFNYPFIAKPADDGCSSAVKKIKNREELKAFGKLIFSYDEVNGSESARILHLKYNEEFPSKSYFLIEDLISKGDAKHFLEVTGGLLTRYNADGEIEYEVFEPSETLATGDVLSLEEKFLAGEGQNITPSRFSKNPQANELISEQVRKDLQKVAEILNIQGYARIDAFVRVFDNNKAETIIIEVNSLPGMTPATCIFHQSAINGYKPYDFIDNILTFGIQREKENLLK
jgi:D-alanine-D-alanine ligase